VEPLQASAYLSVSSLHSLVILCEEATIRTPIYGISKART
jgi:hypothetical protein